MHKIGDVVRLNRGWTPMIVLHIDDDEELWAVYARRDFYNPITRWHYTNYRDAYSYHRHSSGFTAWDGAPINTEWNYIMPTRYRTLTTPSKIGTYLTTTSNGFIVLEFSDGSVGTFHKTNLVEDIPETFSVKSLMSSYTCHYEYPHGALINESDILISESGNMYVVTKTATKYRNPKGIFKGSRLVKESL